jgi:parallel beta-helix repeat protein
VPDSIITSQNNVVARNSTTGATTDGIFVAGLETFCGYVSCDPERTFQNTTGTVLSRNEVSGNRDDGIDVESADTIVRRNTASSNGDLGIEAVSGVTDGGKNRAFGNGNPLQCLNVRCK